ncbi:nucleoid-associated protein [Proteus mirabilis]|jgi:nucleoid-associated protein|uniref:Nucleoid-associated protein n=1 Tax=Proteus mirabilis TaxID=584 RepID=A0AAN3YTA1_PROMI|nr:nucleoid-associated protein [Proteus mirabilis]DAW21496.1 MAG TPA: 37-kD nucleoid-associated bacterial protein [Caudoviricetes sp.]ASB01056.1 hypothetical protein AM403_04990 [Proteus mirabilis]EKV0743492.1 nucleoid-associated protein [Proteus mirabilis]EKV9646384.1 nucleoid-associated protein [Proteus mirabilis]EKW9775348.1 nucleoid-associated protein [Proteus mirabilis]
MTDVIENESMVECPECGNSHGNTELCECGYDPELINNKNRAEYSPKHALTSTLDLVPSNNGPVFASKTGLEWELDSDDVVQFIGQADKKFMRKRKSHGVIKKDLMPLNTPNVFLDYLAGKLNFTSFVNSVMKLMQREANEDRAKLVGGNFVFIHYQVDQDKESDGRLLILMVDKKSAFNFDSNLIPEKIPSINIDALRQAVLIDLTLFKASYPNNDGEPYLHFISGKSKSEFFKRALGCDPKVDNNRSIQNVSIAFDDFSEKMKIKALDKIRVNKAIEDLLREKAKDPIDKKISIEDIADCVAKTLPKRRDIAKKFVQFVDQGEYLIDDFFEPSRDSNKEFGQIKIVDEDRDYEITFDIDSISDDKDSGAKIIYNRDDGVITIKLARTSRDQINRKIPQK